MSRPGVEVTSSASAPATGVPTDTGPFFMVTETSQGPTDAPVRCTSLDDYTLTFGPRLAAWPYGYDSAQTYFGEGGTVLMVQRAADDDAVSASGDATAITTGADFEVANPGAWGNTVELNVVATPGGKSKSKSAPAQSSFLTYPEEQGVGAFMATVKVGGVIVQTSLPLDTAQELADFVNGAGYVSANVSDGAAAVAAGKVSFAGGADGTVPVASDALAGALDAMPKTLGPGQVGAPGHTDPDDHGAILAHCAKTNRVALLDGARGADATELASEAGALRGALEDRYGSLWAPWAVIPGLALGTSRVVPWSAVQAALCARVDRAGNPNQAAAGQWGECNYVTGLDQTFSESDCEALLYAGCNTARNVYGAIQAYAFRTLVDPAGPRADWLELNWARLSMALVADGEAVAQDYVFSQLDGRNHTIAAFGGALTGVCIKYYAMDALFGEDATEAFAVNVGPQVNTVPKLADGILSAVLMVRMSPHAELVRVDIVKYPVTVSLP